LYQLSIAINSAVLILYIYQISFS